VTTVYLDFETYSEMSIDAGARKYACHPSTRILCLAYKVDDGPVQLWKPGEPKPTWPEGATLYAHNALFDYYIMKYCMKCHYSLDGWTDTMALCGRYTLPLGLADACRALGTTDKLSTGKALIRKCCTPKGCPTANDFLQLYAYCKVDVQAMYDMVQALPSSRLSDTEQAIWVTTQEMNMEGLPVSHKEIKAVHDYTDVWKEEQMKRVPEISGGFLNTINQTAKMKEYCGLPNMQAPTVESALLDSTLASDVRELLILRQQLGRSSTAKYKKLLQMEHYGKIHGNLCYYGAGTGRYTGRGFQLQNLPRASVKDPEALIRSFIEVDEIEDPVNKAKALIRPMICAPEGEALICSDYSSIENILLVWCAEDWAACKQYEDKMSQYKIMSSTLYDMPYDEVQKGTIEYQIGKCLILGCGYMMGGKRFLEVVEEIGVTTFDKHQALRAVKGYRALYPKVVDLWYGLDEMMKNAVTNPGQVFKYNRFSARHVRDRAQRRWLLFKLPSGRDLFYCEPKIQQGRFGPEIGHLGRNPYTRQWGPMALSPGRITENAMQALGRDIMCHGLENIKRDMPEVRLIGTVHDEGIGIGDELLIDEAALQKFDNCLCDLPDWAHDLPMRSEGWIGKRYRK